MKHWPIYILTLPDAVSRRYSLLESLKRMEFEFEIVHGIDGRKVLPNCWENDIDRISASSTQGRDLTDGEFACALSHREIYRKITSQNLPGAIILEDDAILDSQFGEFISQQYYLKAPLVMLDHSHARVKGPALDLMQGVSMRKLALPSCLTTAYSISGEAASVLLSAATPVRGPADWPGDIVSLGAVVLDPSIVSHPNPTSGNSSLEVQRNAMPQKQGSITRAIGRFTDLAHWKRWVIKRLSKRIS